MEASVWTYGAEGKPLDNALLSPLEEDVFYLFDADSLWAATMAVFELAQENRGAHFFALFPERRWIERFREQTASARRRGVRAEEARSSAAGGLKRAGSSPRWWAAISGHCPRPAVAAARLQRTPASRGQKLYAGFVSRDPDLAAICEKEFGRIKAGRSSSPHFERWYRLDRFEKELRRQLAREEAFLRSALAKLRLPRANGRGQFETSFDESLARLRHLLKELPALPGPTSGIP